MLPAMVPRRSTTYLFTDSASTISQYRVLVRSRNAFPYLTMSKKTDDAASPMNAAERKQF